MTIKQILQEWQKEAFESRSTDRMSVMYYHIDRNTLFIYSYWPGILIGPQGTIVEKYRKLLNDNNFNYKIRIIELYDHSGVHELKY